MPTNPNMVAIQTVTVGAGGAANIDFTNIPATYTDLYLVTSLRTAAAGQQYLTLTINNDNGTNKYNQKTIRGDGSTVDTYYSGLDTFFYSQALDNNTSNTFNNSAFYIPNYTSSNKKSISFDGVGEDNATNTFMTLIASLYDSTSAITSLKLGSGANFVQHSTATLYGVTSAQGLATGGFVTSDANYYYHTFLASGTFTPKQNLTCDVLVIAGGGGGNTVSGVGGSNRGGGGGAGGLLAHTSQSLTATGYTVTVGAGGVRGVYPSTYSTNGSNSQFGSLTASVGGGTPNVSAAASSGGSGGGGNEGYNGGAGTSGQGNAGANGGAFSSLQGGGGGGAGAAGSSTTGGNGVSTYSSWATATGTGANSGYYAGGGGGGPSGGAGLGGGGGGGGATDGVAGTANTGGGGGGCGSTGNGGAGGSGLVIIRYAK